MFCAALVMSRWIGVSYGSDDFGVGFGIANGTLHLNRGLHEFGRELLGWDYRWTSESNSDWMWLPGYMWIDRYQVLLIPLWIPLLLGLVGTAWAWRSRWKSRIRIGVCGRCGYDRAGLGANVSCPECGARV